MPQLTLWLNRDSAIHFSYLPASPSVPPGAAGDCQAGEQQRKARGLVDLDLRRNRVDGHGIRGEAHRRAAEK